MGVRAGDAIRFFSGLSIFLFLCLIPAVLTAERPLLSERAEAPSHVRGPSEVLSTQAMEAIFAGRGSRGPQPFNLVTHSQPGKIILWDEGPAKEARPVAHPP